MGRASRSNKSTRVLALVLVAAAFLAAGCGSSSGSGNESSTATATEPAGGPPGAAAQSCKVTVRDVGALRATGVSCQTAAQVAAGWTASTGCAPSGNSSRTSCSIGRYRCLSLAADRGIAVSCAAPGHSVSFLAHRSYNGQRPPT
jgi:predicted small secreted protein